MGGQIQAECSVPAGWNARRQESFQQTDQVAQGVAQVQSGGGEEDQTRYAHC